jgi:predicted permease
MRTLAQDLRHGFRLLAKSPGFAFAAVLVLALGLGANTAIFSVVNAVLLRPLPFPDAERLVHVWHTPPEKAFPGLKTFTVSPANFFDWQRRSTSFEAMSLVHFKSLNLAGTGEPVALRAAEVTPEFFGILKARPVAGRAFTPGDAAGTTRLAVLSHALWVSRFGGDPALVGGEIRLDGESYRVLGVMGAEVRTPSYAGLWVPLDWDAKRRASRGNHNCMVLARLKPTVSLARAQAEMDVVSSRLAGEYPEDDAGWGAKVVSFREDVVGDVRPVLLVLLGAVGLVLLIACANVANLVLARTLSRRKEIAVRTALGATRGRLVRQLVSETLVLSLLGGAAGLLVARLGLQGIVAFLADRLPRAAEVAMNAPVYGFAFALAVATGLLAGLVPAWRASRADVATSLKEGLGRTAADSTGTRTRSVLIVAEVGLSLVLLIGAGLLVKSLWLLMRVDPGYDPKDVLTVSVQLPRSKYAEGPRRAQVLQAMLEKLRALPGVEAAGGASNLPLTAADNWPIAIEGRPPVPVGQQPNVVATIVVGDYFRVLKIPLTKGRAFTDADRGDAAGVAVVSESMAKKFWPGEEPLGKRFATTVYPDKIREVVGVVPDVRQDGMEVVDPVPAIYVPLAQIPSLAMDFALRTKGADLAQAAVAAIHEVDPAQPVLELATMEERIARSLSQQRFTMLLLAAFALLAVVLAAIGIYGVLAYTVRRRRREIGIRIALGAQTRDVVRLIVGQGMRPAALGIVLGLVAALAFGRVLTSLVYGITPTDPATFAAVPALLGLVALAACLLPARQAARIGALKALREE